VFTGPPGADAPRFVEVEDDQRGRSVRYGDYRVRVANPAPVDSRESASDNQSGRLERLELVKSFV
jgi:hypothetical protein